MSKIGMGGQNYEQRSLLARVLWSWPCRRGRSPVPLGVGDLLEKWNGTSWQQLPSPKPW